MWSLRDRFCITFPTIEAGIERAVTSDGGPHVSCDLGDCLFAGGTGDVPAFLAAVIERRVTHACVVLVDPEAAAACKAVAKVLSSI